MHALTNWFNGYKLLFVTFFNPSCPDCRQMLTLWLDWDRYRCFHPLVCLGLAGTPLGAAFILQHRCLKELELVVQIKREEIHMHVNRKTGFPGFQKKLLCTAITLSLLPISGAVLAQDDEEVEEIIVTGSFIRRTEGFRSASPLTQLTLEDIAAEGTPNIGDIVHNLSFNQGSSISSNITPGSGATETRARCWRYVRPCRR